MVHPSDMIWLTPHSLYILVYRYGFLAPELEHNAPVQHVRLLSHATGHIRCKKDPIKCLAQAPEGMYILHPPGAAPQAAPGNPQGAADPATRFGVYEPGNAEARGVGTRQVHSIAGCGSLL